MAVAAADRLRTGWPSPIPTSSPDGVVDDVEIDVDAVAAEDVYATD